MTVDNNNCFNIDTAGVSWLNRQETQRLVRMFTDNDIAIRFIGGAARDTVLGREPRDVDMAANAPKERILEILNTNGIAFESLDESTELTKATVGNYSYDIISIPRGMELDGVSTSGMTEEDIWRHTASKIDFTINGLQMTPDGTVHDYFGGRQDAEAGIVRLTTQRSLEEICKRLHEDKRTLLRYMRLHTYYGKVPPDETMLTAIRQSIRALAEAPPQYVQYEMLLLLSSPRPHYMLHALHTHGILRHLLGFDIVDCEPVRALEMIEDKIGYTASSAVRLLLLVLQAEMLPDQALALLLNRWDFPEASRRSLTAMLELLPDMNPDMSQHDIQKLQTALGASFKQLALLAWAVEADVGVVEGFYGPLLD